MMMIRRMIRMMLVFSWSFMGILGIFPHLIYTVNNISLGQCDDRWLAGGIPFMGREHQCTVITMKWKDWVHVTKLDPDKQLKPGDIDAIASSGTDALMLSGTLNVTKENLAALQKQVKAYNLPLVMEPAGPDAVLVQGIDYVFVPSVMNTTDVMWIVGKHRAWVQMHAGKIPWEMVIPEAYIVLNPDSSVGKVTKAVCGLSAAEVAAYTTVADRYFHFPIVYLEYSGTFGDPASSESRIGSD